MSATLANVAAAQQDTQAQTGFSAISQNLSSAADTIRQQQLSAEEREQTILRLEQQQAQLQQQLLEARAQVPLAIPQAPQASSSFSRRDFKIPSATDADKFDGSCKTASAAKACKILNTYFNHIKHAIRLHGFRNCSTEPTHKDNHVTATTFFSSQLQGLALTLYSSLSPVEQDMTTAEYFAWITSNFQPPFLQHDLMLELHQLKHKSGPLAAVRVKFDQILLYLDSLDNPLSLSNKKSLWFNSLSQQLKRERELFEMTQNAATSLSALQDRCIVLDNFNYAANRPDPADSTDKPRNGNANSQRQNVNRNTGNRNNFNHQRNHQRFHRNGNPAPVFNAGQHYVPADVHHHVPMQVDNIQQQEQPSQPEQLNNVQQQQHQQQQQRFPRLTEEEKQTYKANGWCTYCRAKTHVWANCTSPGKTPRR